MCTLRQNYDPSRRVSNAPRQRFPGRRGRRAAASAYELGDGLGVDDPLVTRWSERIGWRVAWRMTSSSAAAAARRRLRSRGCSRSSTPAWSERARPARRLVHLEGVGEIPTGHQGNNNKMLRPHLVVAATRPLASRAGAILLTLASSPPCARSQMAQLVRAAALDVSLREHMGGQCWHARCHLIWSGSCAGYPLLQRQYCLSSPLAWCMASTRAPSSCGPPRSAQP